MEHFDELHKLVAKPEMIRKQASHGDVICAEYLSLLSLNNVGTVWVGKWYDIDDDDEVDNDFYPF